MTGSGNWTYVIDGAAPVMIDAGVGHEMHLAAIGDVCPAGPSTVIVTHAHADHIAGVPAVAARWPAARFARWHVPEHDLRFGVTWQGLRDGDRIEAGDETLAVVHTPGHAPDHIALWHEPSRTLFGGDLVVQGSTVVILASRGGRLRDYLSSLRRVLELSPARVLPAHGPEILDPRTLIAEYLEHREQRERQIMDALEAGLTSPDAMVARIYQGLNPALTAMARESVLAHLLKLQEDGVAAQMARGWCLRQ